MGEQISWLLDSGARRCVLPVTHPGCAAVDWDPPEVEFSAAGGHALPCVGQKKILFEVAPGIWRTEMVYCLDNPLVQPILGSPVLHAEHLSVDPFNSVCTLGPDRFSVYMENREHPIELGAVPYWTPAPEDGDINQLLPLRVSESVCEDVTNSLASAGAVFGAERQLKPAAALAAVAIPATVQPNFRWSTPARKKALEVQRPKNGPAMITIPPGTAPAAAKRLRSLLTRYRNVFANDASEVGRTGVIEYDIILKSDKVQPVTSGKSRPVPPKLQAEVTKEIAKMLKEGVIQESTSPWCSPILCVRKPDGRIRFCIDFREVNDVTQADGGELPHMAAQLHVLRGSKLFATLDASSGYWQVPLTDGAKPVTGFSFQGTHYEFTVLPFGVKNGPSIFARLMNKLLRHLVDRGEPIGIYFDDITVGGETEEHHFQLLEEVLAILETNCITLSTSKASFLQHEAKILGFVVDKDGIMPDEAKVAAIRNCPQPRCASDLRSFLGKINFIGSFIPELQLVLSPLNKLAHLPKGKFAMTPESLAAFQAARELVADKLKNAHPDFSKPFRLTTDASDYGIGGFLSQIQDGKERVVACFSEAFTGAELNWNTRDKELYALVSGTRKFRYFLLGGTFTWVTDHKPLLGPEHQLTAKVHRWRDELSAYDFSTVHLCGAKNATADALSRHIAVMSITELTRSTSRVALHSLSHRHVPVEVLEPDDSTTSKILVPQAAVRETLARYHDSEGHYSAQTVLEKLRTAKLYWPTMVPDVNRYTRSCEACQLVRHGRGDPAPDELTQTPTAPWAAISIDLCSFDEPEGTLYMVLVCDMFTRYVEARVIPSKEAVAVMAALEEMWFMRYPKLPSTVLTDKGTEFNWMEPFRAQFGFEWSRISAGNPQANGMVERANGTFIDGIRKQRLVDPGCTFSQATLRTQMHYNNRVHSSTGFTPLFLQLGLSPDRLPGAETERRAITRVNLKSKLHRFASERSAALADAWRGAYERQQDKKERRIAAGHARHPEFQLFPVGQWVMVKNLVTRKSQAKWLPAPYEVTAVLSGNTYQLKNTQQPLQRRLIRHHRFLRIWVQRDPDLVGSEPSRLPEPPRRKPGRPPKTVAAPNASGGGGYGGGGGGGGGAGSAGSPGGGIGSTSMPSPQTTTAALAPSVADPPEAGGVSWMDMSRAELSQSAIPILDRSQSLIEEEREDNEILEEAVEEKAATEHPEEAVDEFVSADEFVADVRGLTKEMERLSAAIAESSSEEEDRHARSRTRIFPRVEPEAEATEPRAETANAVKEDTSSQRDPENDERVMEKRTREQRREDHGQVGETILSDAPDVKVPRGQEPESSLSSDEESPDRATEKRTREQRRVDHGQLEETVWSEAPDVKVPRHQDGSDSEQEGPTAMSDESSVADEQTWQPPPRRHSMTTRSMARYALRAVQGLGREEC